MSVRDGGDVVVSVRDGGDVVTSGRTTGVLLPESGAALAPLRDWLLDEARREAARLLDDARREAAERLDRTRQEAARSVERARREGADQAAEAADRSAARARRQARRVVLAAQAQVRAQVRDAVHDAVGALAREPGYPAARQALAATARAVLGPQSVVHEAAGGGVCAEAGSRRVDLSLTALADRALAEHESEVARLWST